MANWSGGTKITPSSEPPAFVWAANLVWIPIRAVKKLREWWGS